MEIKASLYNLYFFHVSLQYLQKMLLFIKPIFLGWACLSLVLMHLLRCDVGDWFVVIFCSFLTFFLYLFHCSHRFWTQWKTQVWRQLLQRARIWGISVCFLWMHVKMVKAVYLNRALLQFPRDVQIWSPFYIFVSVWPIKQLWPCRRTVLNWPAFVSVSWVDTNLIM